MTTKILVLGGTGVTGHYVRSRLSALGMPTDYSSRRHQRDAHHVVCDVTGDAAEVRRVFSGYDWIINCTGPYEELGAIVHERCLGTGAAMIDVNDSIDEAARIHALDDDARKTNTTFYTGFGLCPGLSTALLAAASRRHPRATSVRTKLSIGGGQPSGTAAVRSMFRTMRSDYRVLDHGQVVHRPAEEPSEKGFVYYENPDIAMVGALWPGIQRYSYSIRFEVLEPREVRMLQTRRMFTSRLLEKPLAKASAAMANRKLNKSREPVKATTRIDTIVDGHRLIARGCGSYQLTADAACAVLIAAQERGAGSVSGGVVDAVTDGELTQRVLALVEEWGSLSVDDAA